MTAATLTVLAVDLVDASPDQNREHFDERELGELAASIRELGLLQPVTVRPATDRFVLVAGERRLRAVKLLGWAEIPAIVRADDSGADNALRTLAENMVRIDPGALEEAAGLAACASEYGLEPGDLARRLGKTSRWVRERLSLLALADDVAHYVQTGGLPIGRAVLMAPLDVNRQRLALQAHEHGIAPDAFRSMIARLGDEQAADSMFDPDDFMRVDEYVAAAESALAELAGPGRVRELPLGIAEIAELLEVRPTTVHAWRRRGLFPAEDFRCGGSPGWFESTVRDFARETGRAADTEHRADVARAVACAR